MKYSVLTIVALTVCAVCPARGADVSSERHEVIAADKGHIVRYDAAGKAVWEFSDVGGIHRIQQLKNGNILCQQGWQKIIEVTPEKKIVWSYDAANSNGNKGKKLEIHAFQRLENGHTMLVENGIGRVIEVDKNGVIQHEFKYKVKQTNAHRDVRMGYRLENGHYLLCHEGEGRVTEYGPHGEIVWDYEVPLFGRSPAGGHGLKAFGNQVYNAIRLKNGNTMVATGNGHSVLEVTPEKKIVWSVHQKDLPGISLAWVTTLQPLDNGNLIIGNCHAGDKNPQLIEVDRAKNVVWTFKDWDKLGNAVAASGVVIK